MKLQTIPKIEIIQQTESEIEPFYHVIIHNDDVTPMDFVVHVLKIIFFIPESDSMRIMLAAHYKGIAHVQTLAKTEAEKRINKAHFAAGLEGYPLHFSIEAE